MKNYFAIVFLAVCLCFFAAPAFAASIVLHTRSATAWLPQQTVSGALQDFSADSVVIHHDGKAFTIATQKGSRFTFNLQLHDGDNGFWAEAHNNNQLITSEKIIYTLGYKLKPVIEPFATITKKGIQLHAKILNNPLHEALSYHWEAIAGNPSPVMLTHADDSLAFGALPAVDGEYIFKVRLTAGTNTTFFKTMVVKKGDAIRAFDISTQHAAWIDDAIIYCITPHLFTQQNAFANITRKLPELKSLGVNTLWLQPVYATLDGWQGYDIIDYFALRKDLGTEEELKQLIVQAKALGLRVIFDFVPNHTSISHPYAKEAALYGNNSHYYKFYQHADDSAPYSSHYHKDSMGFYYYFWTKLVNLDYNNPEVQQWIIKACAYWVEKLDIDGYRFDAVWGINARNPTFGKSLQFGLKSIKPDLMLLAEDKPTNKVLKQGFDATYDWTADTAWLSQWSWQYHYDGRKDSLTVFNHPQPEKRVMLLRQALQQNPSNVTLRYIENNDLNRFINSHTLQQTKMASALLFALPGIPLLYNGQEIGFTAHPYKKPKIFSADSSIQSRDSLGLFAWYQSLTQMRSRYPALRSSYIKEIEVAPYNTILAYERKSGDSSMLVVINMNAGAVNASLNLAPVFAGRQPGAFTLTDVLSKEAFLFTKKNITGTKLKIAAYTTRIFLLAQQNEKR